MERSKEVYTVVVKMHDEEFERHINVTGWRAHAELGFLELMLADGLRVLFISFSEIILWEVPLIKVSENSEN